MVSWDIAAAWCPGGLGLQGHAGGKVNYKSNPGHLEPENLDSELYLFIYAFLDLFIFHAYVCEPAWVYVYPMCAQEPIEVRRGF